MTDRRWRQLALVPVVYVTVIVTTRLLTLRVVHLDAALVAQLVAVPLAQAAVLAILFAIVDRRRR
jgi:hypothetical protein